MNALLICPSESPETVFYSRHSPLALIPVLGRSALDRALADLANQGAKRILILAADRPDKIRSAVHEGKPWGVHATVLAESCDLSIEEAKLKHTNADEEWLVQSLNVWQFGNATTSKEWFNALVDQLPSVGPETVGMSEIQPGVWVGTHSKVSPDAKIEAPNWIGQHAWIAAGTVIGPRAVIEKSACVEEGAEVVNSFVGPSTYAGGFIELRDSMAWGNRLLNRNSESLIEITDAFLLSDLSLKPRRQCHNLIGRIIALLALILTSPILVLAWLRAMSKNQPLFILKRAAKAPIRLTEPVNKTMNWPSLNGISGLWSRWPLLWSIVIGEFNWVGNSPLTLDQASELNGEFERLWLTVPAGLISLADVEDSDGPLGDAARAHAAFYASNPSSLLQDISILYRAFLKSFQCSNQSPPLTQPLVQS
jgi:lipopolysaccharide/colanic/teichoic acid biosynthesis glycosyltransferase